MVRLCIGALALLASTLPVSAQTVGGEPVRLWVRAESAAWTKPLWVGGGLGISADLGPAVAEAGYAVAESFWGGTSARSVTLAGGLRQPVGVVGVTLLAGPAVSWGRSESESYQALGGTATVALTVGLGPAVEIGAEAQALVNPHVSAIGGGPVLRVKLAGGR